MTEWNDIEFILKKHTHTMRYKQHLFKPSVYSGRFQPLYKQ